MPAADIPVRVQLTHEHVRRLPLRQLAALLEVHHTTLVYWAKNGIPRRMAEYASAKLQMEKSLFLRGWSARIEDSRLNDRLQEEAARFLSSLGQSA
ncbi:hypothetical protein [Gloeobacter morelensis]|uniref:hypothetical protein n=1 Tax=Gloeobacter morelensis TaxID=2907343 RepID=UPI001E3B480E|nr:hypothetical protein [Gloeobacter morelensis]UFP97158.1 hypothetical protein ISF26_23850 [Gloeobacter morelensis MG652769]